MILAYYSLFNRLIMSSIFEFIHTAISLATGSSYASGSITFFPFTNVERNGDIVEMSSFAPLLSKNGHSNWSTDLIYFDNTSVKTTPDYEVQKMFATHNGSVYIESNFDIDEALRKFVGISVVRNSHTGKTWLKIVNILPQPLNIHIDKRTVTVNARDYKIVEL